MAQVENENADGKKVAPLTTENAVTNDGILVKQQEPVEIIGTGKYEGMSKDSKHTVHRIHAEKLVGKGLAEYANAEDKPKAKSK